MADIDTLSTPEWTTIVQSLEIDKPCHEIETSDIIGKELESLDQWETFFNIYAKWVGFSIRIDDVKRKNDIITMRRWVCSKEGFRRDKFINLENRQKRPKPITRTGCQAALRVVQVKDTEMWKAKEFVAKHNHETASPSELQFLRSNRIVSDGLLAQVRSMNKVGIKTSQIMAHVALSSGGYDKLPCQLRDIYNKVADARRKEKLETDSEAALSYLDSLSQKDPDFYVEYQVDDQNRLSNLFWADGNSRRDYMIFGEALAFDTTYKTNEYNKPLTILVGVNHHFETCVFGLALLLDETIDTYSWLLRVFSDCMGNKKPSVILTDGDPAMRFAISEFFPAATHRLCSWHLGINASKNIKDPLFKQGFVDLMYNYYTEDVFVQKWCALLERFELLENDWCQLLYERRMSWAETYLRGQFFGGMRTTQRCESINSFLKQFLQAHYPLKDFVSQIDLAVSKMRHNELRNDYTSKHTSPQLPPSTNVLFTYYEQCSKVFTRNIYYKVAEQISKENAYWIHSREEEMNCSVFNIGKFPHGDARYTIRYDKANNSFQCICLLFETDGYPCRHIWAVLKTLGIKIIPDSLLMKRWRKDAKSSSHVQFSNRSSVQEELIEMARFGSLNSEANMMNYYASKSENFYKIAKNEIARLTALFKDGYVTTSANNNSITGHRDNPNIIKDPIIVKTKGSGNSGANRDRGNEDLTNGVVKKARVCRICLGVGHDARNCPDRDRVRRGHGGATTSTNATQDSTQDSITSSDFLY